MKYSQHKERRDDVLWRGSGNKSDMDFEGEKVADNLLIQAVKDKYLNRFR